MILTVSLGATSTSLGLLPAAIMLVALVAVGWGFGLAAALARCSVDTRGTRNLHVSSPIGACLAVLVAAGALGGYLVVLRAIGFVAY